MARRARLIVALAAIAAVGGCQTPGPDTIGSFVDEIAPTGSRGVIAAAQADELLVCEGWGAADEAGQDPFDCDTVVDIMSMTKQFTAAAVLKLQMLGEMSVSDPIGDYLDDVPPDKRAITIEHLLTHTSGLVEGLGGDDEPMSRAELVAGAMAAPLEADPGTRYAYSNLGYSMLAAVIEIVSGQGYEEFLAEHLFEPAGMTATGYVLPDWSVHAVAVEYDAQGRSQGRPLDHLWAQDGPYWNLRGNGGLLSSARDLFRWHVALLGEDVLDAASKEELFAPRVSEGPDGTFYGYGWVLTEHDDVPVAWHNGGNDSSYGELARTPDGAVMMFWATTQRADERHGWDFENDLGADLTDGLLTRLL